MPTRKTAAEIAVETLGDEVKSIDGMYVDHEGKPLGLVARLAMIMGAIPAMEPEGRNEHFKYKFIKDKQVLGAVRPRLSANKILIIPETVVEGEPITMTTARGGSSLMTRMTVTWRVICGLTGESITGQSIGYGDDGGDKGANKAYTAALKNFLLKLFEIGGESDLEDDASTDERAKARDRAPAPSEVKITPAKTENVLPGGRQTKATETQVARVGQYIRDLNIEPAAFVALVEKTVGDKLELGAEPWIDIRDYLNNLPGEDIGKIVAAFAAIESAQESPETT